MKNRKEIRIEQANSAPSRISITEFVNEGELSIVRPPFGNVLNIRESPTVFGNAVIVSVGLLGLLGLSALLGGPVSRFLHLSLPFSYVLICCFAIVCIGIGIVLYRRRACPPIRLVIKKKDEYTVWLHGRDQGKPDHTGNRQQLSMRLKEERHSGWIKLKILNKDEGYLVKYWISHNDLTRVKEFCQKYNCYIGTA